MTAYIIANNHLTEYEGSIGAYRARVTETAQSFGGRYLARGTPAKVLEGQWLARQRNVISAWPDAAAAEKFFLGDIYQKEIRPHRIGTSVNDIGLFAGVAAPPDDIAGAAFMLILGQIAQPPSTIGQYRAEAEALVAKFGGRYLVSGECLKTLEGEWLARMRVILISWPSMAAATDFWGSPEYAKIKPLRAGGASVYDVALFAPEKH